MLLPDVNILIYAYRVNDPAHDFYAKWLDALVNGRAPFALSVLVASAFARVVTNPKFPPAPADLDHALGFIDAVASSPACRWVGAGPGTWSLVRDLCSRTRTTGPRISDAHHAAVAIEHGCTFVTRDPDFRRFEAHGLDLDLLEPI